MALDKNHKAFRSTKLMPVDANNVILEQAFARFLVLVRTSGLPITTTTKDELHPDDLVDLIADDTQKFAMNLKADPQRKRLLSHWIAGDFATCIRERKSDDGEARIANLKPIHMSTIKLIDPRIRSQDRDVSVFLFNVFRDSGLITDDLLPFLTRGTVDFGEHDFKFSEAGSKGLDIETFFLLRVVENFRMDKVDKKKKVSSHEFLCPAQKQLIVNDTARLLLYKDSIPRRELIAYLIMLFAFHTALYCIKSFSIVNSMAETKRVRCSRCKGIKTEPFDDLPECDHHPDIFVDLTNGQDEVCDGLARDHVANHYSTMYRYFRSHYKLKKLDEFASTFPGYSGSVDELIKFMNHKDLDSFFRWKLGQIVATEEDEDQDPEVRAILDLGLPPFDSYVEILFQKTFKSRVKNHKKLMGTLCGLNQDDGFLHGGRGKRRKYVLGSQLLELLVQLAVVSHRGSTFTTTPITIPAFVRWLKNRYGIHIDATGEQYDSPEVARALEANYTALKERLRQLGFFTDLSDASISQVIRPRFPIQQSATV